MNTIVGGDESKRPTNDFFNKGLSIDKFAYMALSDLVTDVTDDDYLKFLQKDVITTEYAIVNTKKIEECAAPTVKIGVSCSMDSPPQKIIQFW